MAESDRHKRSRNKWQTLDAESHWLEDGESPEAKAKRGESQRQASKMEAGLVSGFDELETGKDQLVTLKNGTTIDVKTGRSAWGTLNDLLEQHPHLFKLLHSKIRGEEITPEAIRELRKALLVLPSGEVRESLRNVLLSGYQETKDGPVIVNPFKLDSESDRQAFTEAENLRRRNDARLGIVDSLDDSGPSSPR
jgi:hypothetical protein